MTDTSLDASMGQVTDFALSPELQKFRDLARRFAEDDVKPQAAQLDVHRNFPKELIEKAAALGLLRITVPKAYGGSDMGNLAACLMLEELNAACASTGVTVSVHNSLVCSPLAKWGSEDQKQRYFPKLADGSWLGAYCLSEAGSGSDAAGLVCEAKKTKDGWVLNGAKLWITTGSEAELFVVFARTGPDRVKGISAFLVEKSMGGLSVGKKERKLGIRGSPTVEILLEDVLVPEANLLGEEGRGFTIALDTLDGGRLGIASQALGIARACHDTLKEHLASQRDVRNRPSASQAAQYTLADIAADLDAYRFLTWRAAILRDNGVHCGKEAAMAKLTASRLANRAARETFALVGAEAAGGNHLVERLVRDARITEIYEGVTDIQRLVIARGVLGV